jgi:hypothetical protein
MDEGMILLAARVAALQRMAAATGGLLADVIDDSRENGHLGLAVAASHLRDSLEVFATECERALIKKEAVK